MSVQTEIDRISTAVQNAHLKVIEKGGTSAAPYLVANLPDAIDTIPEATEPKLQAKTATPSETAQTVKPDSGYDGLSQVSVGAISKTYVGSGVTKQAAKTITPSTSSQTAVASGVYTTGTVTVAAIPSTYVKPTATKAATTYTPSTSNQTIAAGTYCSGAQTIKGDSNLVAGNIKSGVSIFGVAGTLTAGEDVTAETNTYTSLLTDLEEAVDALPDAGGGGASGGGAQAARGVITLADNILTPNTLIANITGLGFAPKYVLIVGRATKYTLINTSISGKYRRVIYLCEHDGTTNYSGYVYQQYISATSTDGTYGKIVLNSDGFSFYTGTNSESAAFTSFEYHYVAIG